MLNTTWHNWFLQSIFVVQPLPLRFLQISHPIPKAHSAIHPSPFIPKNWKFIRIVIRVGVILEISLWLSHLPPKCKLLFLKTLPATDINSFSNFFWRNISIMMFLVSFRTSSILRVCLWHGSAAIFELVCYWNLPTRPWSQSAREDTESLVTRIHTEEMSKLYRAPVHLCSPMESQNTGIGAKQWKFSLDHGCVKTWDPATQKKLKCLAGTVELDPRSEFNTKQILARGDRYPPSK